MGDALLAIPTTNDTTIIFHFDPRASKWDRSAYYPHMTGGRASTQEIDQALTEIETVYARISRALTKIVICFFVSLFLVGFIGNFFIDFNDLKTVKVSLLILMSCIFGMVTIIFKISQQFRLQCQPLVDNQINQRFIPRGLRWHLPANFPYWIELHNDHLRYQPVNILPVANQHANLNEAPQQNAGQLYPQLPPVQPQDHNIYIPPSQH